MDNYGCHYLDQNVLDSLRVKHVFLPPNCTSRFQPLDQGIFWAIKSRFKMFLLQSIQDKFPQTLIDVVAQVYEDKTEYDRVVGEALNANADAILSEVQRFNNNTLKAFEIAEYLDRAWESIDKAMIIRFFLRSNCPPDNPVLKAAKLCIELELNPQTKAANTKLLRRLNLTRELINTPFYNPVIEVKIDNGVEGDLDFLYADNVQHFSTSCLASAEFLHVKAADRAMFNLDTNIDLHKQEQSNNVDDDNIMRYVLTGHLLESDGVAKEHETEIDKCKMSMNV